MSSGHDFTQPHHLHQHHHPHPNTVTPSTDTANNKPQPHSATELPQSTSSVPLPTSSSTSLTSPSPPPTMSCVYKSQSPTGKTILITTTGAATVAGLGSSQSANGGPGGTGGVPNPGTASSQITIFTHHHHHASASAAAAAAMADGGHSSSVAVNTVHGHGHHVAGAKSAAGSVGINILINNHFNEPAPAPKGGGGPALLPTTVTIKEDPAGGVKRERTMKTEPMDEDQPMELGGLCKVATADSSEQRAAATDFEGTVAASKTALQTSTTTVTVTNTAGGGGGGGSLSHQHHHHLSVGDEVFAVRPDDSGHFHLGTIVVVQPPTQPAATGQCLVRFGDGQEGWSAVSEVQRFSEREAAMPMCIVCKEAGGEVAHKCAECGCAFHPRCAGVRADGVWFCRRGHRNEAPLVWRREKVEGLKVEEAEEELGGGKMEVCGTEDERQRAVVARVKRTMQLPYVLDALTWDKPHRHNAERTYCYCGRTGEWHTQMLQCVRCEQWFHERCADALSYPLYCGDRFYIFACALCNGGAEFVRRQQMRLDDLVHLLLFNLSVHNPQRRYFDVATAIVPYAIDNWHTLQLAPKLRNMSVADIRERIAKCLANNPARFKPRTSLSLRTTSSTIPRSSQFALCDRNSPPLAPTIPIALAARTQPLTDELVAQLCRRQSLLPLSGQNQHNGGGIQLVARSQIADGLVALSPEMRYTMSGRAYMKPRPTAVQPSSTEASVSSSSPSPSPSSATEEESDQFQSDDDDEVLANLGKKSLEPARNDRTNSSSESCYSTSNNNNNNHKTVALKLAAISNGAESSSSSSADIYDYCSAREEAEANALVPLRPSPNSSLTSNGSGGCGQVGVSTLATTSPTESAATVIVKPTVPAVPSSNPSTNSTATVTTTHHQHKRKRGRPLAPSAIAAAIAESAPHSGGYSSDDNSSRGALDLIIPPPKDFQGLNNPFLSQPTQRLTHIAAHTVGKSRPRGKGRGGRGTKGVGGVVGVVGGNLVQLGGGAIGGVGAVGIGAIAAGGGCGAVNGAVRIVRTVKRRLSARDLVIGPNMEVKRRKVRRGSGGGGAGGEMMVEVISTATVVRTDFKDLPLTPMHHQVAGQPPAAVQTSPVLQHIVVPPPPPPTLMSAYRPEQAYGIGGRRLRKRIDTNYAESGRRSGGAAAAAAAAAAVNNSSNSNSCSSNSSSSATSSVGPASTVSSFSQISSSSLSSSSSSSSSSSATSAFGDAMIAPMPEAGGQNAAPTPNPTPAAASVVASAPAPSLTDLQSSLTMYFGAANRMANGERFAIRGKRVGLDGRRQYLIEWDA